MTRKYLILFVSILGAIYASAAVKSPDFAYPKQVLANADKALKAARAGNDDLGVLNALMLITVADQSIDNNTLTSNYRLVIDNAAKMRNRPARALTTLYAASILKRIYSEDRYKIYRRPTVSPRPQSIDEWCYNDFNAVIDSLTREAWSLRTLTPIDSLTSVIEIDDNARRYYPTQTDCLASIIRTNSYTSNSDLIQSIWNETQATHPLYSPAYYYWLSVNPAKPFNLTTFRDVYMAIPDDDTARLDAALILWEALYRDVYITASDIEEVIGLKQFMDMLAEARKRARGTWLEGYLESTYISLTYPGGTLAANKYFSINQPVRIQIHNYTNIDSVTVYVQPEDDKRTNKNILSQTIRVSKSLHPADTVAVFDLPPGNYTAWSQPDNKVVPSDVQRGSTLDFKVISGLPYLTADSENIYVYVGEAQSGKPLPGCEVTLHSSLDQKSKKFHATTDHQGFAVFDVWSENKNIDILVKSLTLSSDGCSWKFDIRDYINREDQLERNWNWNIATDLPVYHPNDSVRFVAVLNDGHAVSPDHVAMAYLKNIDYQEIASQKCVTDNFGRIFGSFHIPQDAKTGYFSLEIQGADEECDGSGNLYFQVSDFKVDAYRFADIAVLSRINNSDSVRISGRLETYSGVGIADASIHITIDDHNGDTGVSTDVSTDSRGQFSITLPYRSPENKWVSYNTKIAATAPDGTVLTENQIFNPSYPYSLSVSTYSDHIYFAPETFNTSKPLHVSASLTEDNKDNNMDVPIVWSIFNKDEKAPLLTGNGRTGKPFDIDISTLSSGMYSFSVATQDSTLACKMVREITLFDPKSVILPKKDNIIWTPYGYAAVTASTFTIGISEPGAWLTIMQSDGKPSTPTWYEAGYHNIPVPMPEKYPDSSETKIRICAIRDCMIVSEPLNIKYKNGNTIHLSTDFTRDKCDVGVTEKLVFHVRDNDGNPVQAAAAMNIYNTRLNALRKLSPLWIFTRGNSPSPIFGYERGTLSEYSRLFHTALNPNRLILPEITEFPIPSFLYPLHEVERVYAAFGMSALSTSARSNYKSAQIVRSTSDSAKDEVVEEEVAADAGETTAVTVPMREGVLLSALWRPDLVTDSNGDITVPWTVPGENTKWQIYLTAWTHNALSTQYKHTVTVSRPLMVSVNTPRFIRRGDEATIIANIMNDTDKDISADVSLDASTAPDVRPFVSEVKKVIIPAQSNISVQIPLNTLDRALMGRDTVFVSVRGIMEKYSDGERMAIPVLRSQCSVTDSHNFYLNPGDTTLVLNVPRSHGSDFTGHLTYTSNPMWTVVEALRVLSSDQKPITAPANADMIFSSATALGLMKEHPELELEFKVRDLNNNIRSSVEILAELQTVDGGFRWGAWSSEPSLYITLNVLDKLAVLKRAGYLPDDKQVDAIIVKAVEFCDKNVKGPNLVYAAVRPTFRNISNTLNGTSVIDASIQQVLAGWKSYSIPQKASAAMMLELNGNHNMARTLLGSLTEFGTTTRSKGFEFMNVHSLHPYALALEAYGAISPHDAVIDGLRQYLIVRRQGTVWGNNIITSLIISAMVNSGTPWTVAPTAPQITVDGKPLNTAPISRMGVIDTDIDSPDAEITIVKASETPSYGALTTTYTAPMADIPEYSDGEISVSKQMLVSHGNSWVRPEPGAPLRVGDIVKIRLIIKVSRPLSNVTVTDERAATFEPKDQLSRMVYTDGVAAYRENRDAVTNLYFNYVPKGTYLVEYDMKVQYAGSFASGVASVTCLEAPSLTAHSAGSTITVIPVQKSK